MRLIGCISLFDSLHLQWHQRMGAVKRNYCRWAELKQPVLVADIYICIYMCTNYLYINTNTRSYIIRSAHLLAVNVQQMHVSGFVHSRTQNTPSILRGPTKIIWDNRTSKICISESCARKTWTLYTSNRH